MSRVVGPDRSRAQALALWNREKAEIRRDESRWPTTPEPGVAVSGSGRLAREKRGVGDVITATVKQASPQGGVRRAVVEDVSCAPQAVRPLRRNIHLFDENAAVLIDPQNNPRGTRIFGPVARELRERNFMRIVSLAPEVL